MNLARTITRRTFLRSSLSLAGACLVVPRHLLGGRDYQAPSESLTRGIIGVGGMGKHHIRRDDYRGPKLLAVCDVDRQRLNEAIEVALQWGDTDVTGYTDFRELLERPDIDLLEIATPPHWHGLICIAAARAGKDIWCEKPLTRTIGEGQQVVKTVQQYNRIFRINTWGRYIQWNFHGLGSPVPPIKKLVDAGVFGWPLRITLNPSTGFDWKWYWNGRTNLKPQWVPEELDYDFWLGPAPFKPYHVDRVHGRFRGYWDYDGGGLGDMGQHYLDPVQYLLGKDHTSPVAIEADAPQQHPDAVQSWHRIEMQYTDGCEIIFDGDNTDKDAPFLKGPKGKLYQNMRSDIPNLKQLIQQLPDPEPQVTDFHEAVRTRQRFVLNEENGHRSCTLVNLAKIAVRVGRLLRFDPESQLFIDDEGANRLVHQPMRAPWRMA